MREKYDKEINELSEMYNGIGQQQILIDKRNELAEDIRKTIIDIINGIEFEDEFYGQILDKMVVNDREHIDVYLKMLPQKWSFAVENACKTAEIKDCVKENTDEPISVSSPLSSGYGIE